MKRVVVPCNQELLDKSYDILWAQVGVTEETGKNDGEQVEEYLASVGLSKGNPYCSAGQYYCFWKACQELNMDIREIPIPKTGLAINLFNKSKSKHLQTPYIPEKHDLIIWIKPNGINGHVERIVKVLDESTVETIAFNTSNGKTGNQREGDGVFLRQRKINKKLGNMKILALLGFITNEENYNE